MESSISYNGFDQMDDDDLYDILADLEQLDDIADSTDNFPQEENDKQEDVCPTCDSTSLVEDFAQGIVICSNCGQVVSMVRDARPEWSNFDGPDRSRCSMPTNPLLPQSSLGTSMKCWGMIKKLHDWSAVPYRERMLRDVLKDIEAKCRAGNIIKCIEDDAKILFKNISECKHQTGDSKGRYIIIRGSNRDGIIAACVFFACKRKNQTRSPTEIAKIFGLRYTDITKGCKNFQNLIKLRKINLQLSSSQPIHFVSRYCKKLRIRKDHVALAEKIAHNASRLNIASDHTPPSVATSAIMLMAELRGLSLTKKSIAVQFDVSEVTITKTYRKLRDNIRLILCDKAIDLIEKRIKQQRAGKTMSIKVVPKLDDIIVTNPEESIKQYNHEYMKMSIRRNTAEMSMLCKELDKESKELDIMERKLRTRVKHA